ncbi:putative 37S ribosomal protein [Seiridium unicorne]|uniref:37S ribosomal protein n=1 Tax=Seiridium unicorne TaxID=138068 RepID=A0ABR2V547_9PEZI
MLNALFLGKWLTSLLVGLLAITIFAPTAAAGLQIYNESSTYHYAGCWNETTDIAQSSGERALPDVSLEQPGTMTVEVCLDFCAHNQSSSYKYAGLEYSRQCWCANRLSSLSTLLDDSACDTQCDGNKTEACGGSLKLSLYNITTSGGASAAGRLREQVWSLGSFIGLVLVTVAVVGFLLDWPIGAGVAGRCSPFGKKSSSFARRRPRAPRYWRTTVDFFHRNTRTMFKPRLRIPRVSLPRQRPAPLFRRDLHQVPYLHIPGSPATEGIAGLLSEDGFNLAYTQYMQFAIEKLNALTAGTDLEQMPTRNIISKTAREPSQAPIFNYASMVHNTHFFFENLKPREEPKEELQADATDPPNPIPEKLKVALEGSFSSMETLRLEMSAIANAMFGPGFVWLVKIRKLNEYRILTTYLAGSPYTDAHWRRQPFDTNTIEGPTSAEKTGYASEFFGRSALGAGADNGSQWAKNNAPGGIDVTPVLCLNTWEHVWLRDYGIGVGGYGGKRLYIENWWNCINWEAVMEHAQLKDRDLKV